MFPLVRMHSQQILLIVAPGAAREQMLAGIAMQACQGRVRVIDGGNQFNVYRIARQIRRKTHRLHEALQNIQVSRSFSCYQMTGQLEKTPAESAPLFVLDFLFSYYDEDIRLEESLRLLKKSLRSCARLGAQAPLVLTVRSQMYNPERHVLLEEVKEIATQLWEAETPETAPAAVPLLPWPQQGRE